METDEEYDIRPIEYDPSLGDTARLKSRDEDYLNDKTGQRRHHLCHSGVSVKKGVVVNRGFVGEFILPSGFPLRFEPKTPTSPFELYDYSKDEFPDDDDILFFDVDTKIEMEKGPFFFDFLAVAFLKELDDIINHGLVVEYVRRDENIRNLKGRLVIHQQVRRNAYSPNFHCRHFDLTVDNMFNRSMLFVADHLTRLVSSSSVKADLRHRIAILSDSITLVPSILPQDLKSMTITQKSENYLDILDLMRIVVDNVYFNFTSSVKPKDKGFNYLISMNLLFERAIYVMLSRVFKRVNNDVSTDYQMKYTKVDVLAEKPNKEGLNLKPDMIVNVKGKGEAMVVDFKYKPSLSNSDFYQTISYSLFLNRRNSNMRSAMLARFNESSSDFQLSKGSIKTGASGDVVLYELSIPIMPANGTIDLHSLESLLYDRISKGNGDAWEDLRTSLL